MSEGKRAVIIGAGPAGLTAAYELLKRTDVIPIVLEKSDEMGGISRTVKYKGNRMDIGGHRFFSKSNRVMDWWIDMLPMQGRKDGDKQVITYQRKTREVDASTAGPDPEQSDEVMLFRGRKSRIYFLRKFFDYPITLSANTLRNLGAFKTIKIGFSYLKAMAFPIKDEQTLEDFFINRFGRELYLTFFKSYTEKVWGVPCNEISAEWGAQRIKGLSITKAVMHVLSKPFKKSDDVKQKGVETSLIEQFLYPKFGPGQMWEMVAEKVKAMGGQVLTGYDVVSVNGEGNRVSGVDAVNRATGEKERFDGDYIFSTMPVKQLIQSLTHDVPASVREVSEGLLYRDFITVGLLLNKLKIKENTEQGQQLIRDNWIYIQEPDVTIGRLQVFNNWSPYLVADQSKVWLGLEYFCYETDDLWKLPDEEMIKLGCDELDKIDIIEKDEVIDATVIRVEKTYPAYFGTYDRFDEIRDYLDKIENLFLVGRNGMHRYNNQDHSMLASMTAVDNISTGRTDKTNIWDVNTETEYHEAKTTEEADREAARSHPGGADPGMHKAPDQSKEKRDLTGAGV